MNNFPSKAVVEARKARYKPGVLVELVRMNDPFSSMQSGEQGRVIAVDDTGTVHIQWNCGSTLGAVYGEDEIRLLPAAVSDKVREQILAVRATGATNMFDTHAVQRLASDSGFYELVDFIETDRKAYSRFILTGERDPEQFD